MVALYLYFHLTVENQTAAVSPASSTPSISRSNIGASSALPSPSTHYFRLKLLDGLKMPEILQYHIYHRLILTPNEDGSNRSDAKTDKSKHNNAKHLMLTLLKIRKLHNKHMPIYEEEEEIESDEE
ncbi:hypothetical protein HAX54_030378 [Datura stramonium]|uniref:Uncharacterized protein n=1 Tax=Datura stramonium TaxID=4076 RepID=A0ABS8SAY8_DATST|nr:hypothetical protein [Datura stramonium]